MFDITIVGGTVVDGTGTAGIRADVGIVDGRVAAIEPGEGLAAAEAGLVIDASDRVVTPGFVDIHTHYDAQILWDPMLSVSPWHGVTTVVTGNCGFGVAPTRAEHRDLVIRTLEKVEGMSAEALRAGLGDEWPFETFPQYLDVIEAMGSSINVAPLVGHTPVRLSVMGEEATERAATGAEVAAMRAVVAEAMAAGALGFATSKSPTHVGWEGRPVPSRSADVAEILEIAGALGDVGRGVIQATMGPDLTFEQFAEISRATGRPVSWTALLAGVGGPGVWQYLLSESAALLDAGVPVHPQVSCRPLVFEFSMAEPFPFEGTRIFAPVAAAHDAATKVTVYRDPEFRSAFASRMAAGRAGALGGSWERTVVSWFPPEPSLEGRSVAALADERGADPTHLVLDLAIESGLDARFRMATLNYDDDDVEVLLTDPHTMLGLSDAGAHASQLCDACFSTHLLSHWVRDRGALTLEEAVRKLTSEPADIFGITDRGRLAVGRPADVVVLDPLTVGCSDLRRVHDQPAGAARLVSDASGIDAVVVNGVLLRRDGADALVPGDALPGRLLRGGAA